MGERILSAVLLLALGLLAGTWGLCLVGAQLGPVPYVGLWVGVVVDALLALVAAELIGRRDAVIIPAVGWFAAVTALSSLRPGGDVLTPQEWQTALTAYLLLGVAGFLAPGLIRLARSGPAR